MNEISNIDLKESKMKPHNKNKVNIPDNKC